VLLLFGLATLGLLWHARLYGPFVTDDAYISFVYARNLAQHGQLVFNLGEHPVEGYTNFLWTVLLAGLLRLGLPPERTSIVLGVALAAATLLVAGDLARRLRARDADGAGAGGAAGAWSAWDTLPALLLAAVPGFACWAGGGLETQLFTFLLTLGLLLYLEDAPALASPRAGLVLGLAALTRPEGNLFFVLLVLHCSMERWRAGRPLLDRGIVRLGLAFSSLVVPHLIFRRLYYGWWLPNTFYIKAAGGAGTWQHGGHYLWRFSTDYLIPLWLLLPLLALVLRRNKEGLRALVSLLALLVPAFLLYVASVGGDFMGLYRFALPIVPVVLVGAALGLRALVAGPGPGRALLAPGVSALALGALLAADLRVVPEALRIDATIDRGIIDPPGYLRYYTEDRAAIGRWFGRHARPDDYMVVGGAGAQVYWSGIRSLDAFGLSDEYIAHRVAPVSSRPGHQKYAPLEYQLARHPTIITSSYYNIGGAPLVRPDAAEWRARGYHYVSVQIPGLSAPWYTFLKRMDRSLGPLPAVDADLN
jgi:arabinofuranosyltransferase